MKKKVVKNDVDQKGEKCGMMYLLDGTSLMSLIMWYLQIYVCISGLHMFVFHL